MTSDVLATAGSEIRENLVNEHSHLCDACLRLAIQAVLEAPGPSRGGRHVGHRHVCICCGQSVLRQRFHSLRTDTDLERHIVNVLAHRIHPRQVTTAVKFLQNPNVQRCTMESKQRFLRSKGLSDPEIQKAIDKCTELLDIPSMTSELMVFQPRGMWFRDHFITLLAYGGFAYGCYWFYKNCIRQLLFVEEPKRKSTSECIDELRKSLDILNTNVTSLRTEMAATAQQNAMRSQLDNIKTDIASVKGILLNRNQFPALKTRTEPPCIPSWQRQSEEATSTEVPAEEIKKPHRTRSQRSESGGSNSSEGEQATKNSDSSLEIMQRSVSGGSNSSEGEQAAKNSDSSLEIIT